MPRTVRDAALENRAARGRLKARNKPYYRAIEPGLHLGYRKPLSGAGRWIARHYLGGQAYELETIATADDFSDADGVAILNFGQAQARAREQMVLRAHAVAGKHGPYTVEDAINDYLQLAEANHRKSVADARYRVEALILPELGRVEVAKLTAQRLRQWHADLANAPSRAWTRAPQLAVDDEAKRRRRATANRVLAIVKAALALAWREGKVSSDAAWRRVEPFKGVNAARIRYLTIAEAQRLINACEPDFRQLVQAALQTGARLGELVRLEARDFNADVGTLTIRQSKAGKVRHVVLTEEGVDLFRQLCAGQSGDALLLRRADDKPWGQAHQFSRIAEACRHANIVPPINFHGMRHTFASLSVMSGMPLIVVAKNLGHRDKTMVERHYSHLSASYLAESVRAHAPRFGLVEPTNVKPLKL